MAANSIHGGCLCGGIRYEASGEPYNVTHRHCEDCRKSAGVPFVTWASFRRNNFRFTRGAPGEIEWADAFDRFGQAAGRH